MKTTVKTNKTVHILKTASEFLNGLISKLNEASSKVPDGWNKLNITAGSGIEFFPDLMEIVETATGIKDAVSTITLSSLTIEEELTEMAENSKELMWLVNSLKRKCATISAPDFSGIRNHPASKRLLADGLITDQFFRNIDSIITGVEFRKEIIDLAINELENEHPIPQSNNVNTNFQELSPKERLLSNPKAVEMLNKLVVAGFCDENYMWIRRGHTNSQKAVAAYEIGIVALKTNYYPCFEELWECKGLASDKYKAINLQTPKATQKVQEIRNLFS